MEVECDILCWWRVRRGEGGDGREIGAWAELAGAGILLSAQWSVVRAVAARGASGETGGPADLASQPGELD